MKTFLLKARHFFRLCATLLLVVVVNTKFCLAVPASDELQTLTVAFLYNFLKLSEWPTKAALTEFTVCVGQASDFGSTLETSISGKQIQDKPLKVKHLLPGDDASVCQLVFISSEEKPINREKWLKDIDNKPILSVSDSSDFLDHGGMIMLVNDGSHLQFEVNLVQAEQQGINMSSQILQIARNVRGK
ncbi:MAG: YfiR family protein [Methyloglobulus sp.]|nr:YfiR family protein [Methyloglobulus sp.]